MNKPIRSYDTFCTNIAGLPEGEYLTETGYSDTYPVRVVSRTASTVTVQRVETVLDPEWKPEVVMGGFVGHCTNNNAQKWVFAGLSERTFKLRLVKSRFAGSDKLWRSKGGSEFIANGAVRKHDYNF